MSDEKLGFEEEVFKVLDHQLRRDILRYIGKKHWATFTDIMRTTGTPDSPTLSYHLRALSPMIEQKNGKYLLSPVGKAAYGLLLKTVEYGGYALIQKNKAKVMIGNAILWASAIVASLVLEVDTFLSTIILPILSASSLYVIYELFE